MLTTSPAVTAVAPSPRASGYSYAHQYSPRHHHAVAPLQHSSPASVAFPRPPSAPSAIVSAVAQLPPRPQASSAASAASPAPSSCSSSPCPSPSLRRQLPPHQSRNVHRSDRKQAESEAIASSRVQHVPTDLDPEPRPEIREMDCPGKTSPHTPAERPMTNANRLDKPFPTPLSPSKRRNSGTMPPGPRTAPLPKNTSASASATVTGAAAAADPGANVNHVVATSFSDGPDSSSKRAKAETQPKVVPLRYETMDVEDLVNLIAHMLSELIATNDPMALTSGRLTRFHSRTAPGISVRDYLQRLAKHATLTPAVLLSMVYYIDRLCSLYPEFTINTLTVHRFLITAAAVGAKGLSDSFWNNTTYARVGGVRIQELKTLELEFLTRVDWKIVPQPEVLVAYYKGLIKRCPDYVLESVGGDEEEEKEEDDTNNPPPSASNIAIGSTTAFPIQASPPDPDPASVNNKINHKNNHSPSDESPRDDSSDLPDDSDEDIDSTVPPETSRAHSEASGNPLGAGLGNNHVGGNTGGG